MGRKKKDGLTKSGEEIVKKRGRGGKENFPTVIPSDTKKEDVKRIMGNLLKWYELPKAVSDEEIAERLKMFFTVCFENGEIPTVEKMSMALGYDRKTLWAWETGREGSTPVRGNLIKKAKELLASFDAEMVTEGKINPVTYIFRAKNYFGLQDKQEYVLTPNNPLGDTENPEEIQQRLLDSLPEDDKNKD